MPATDLPIPFDIPWQLAGTTRYLLVSRPLPANVTSLSLFTYVPKLETLDTAYPDDRILYLKLGASISPASSPLNGISDAGPEQVLGTLWPIRAVVVDLRIEERGATSGGQRPYFMDAAPLRRTMVETGVAGDQILEGETNQIAVGRSGTQLHEVYNSTTKTSGWSAGLEFGVLAGGIERSTTSITGSREAVTNTSITEHKAGEERKELFSHFTNVSNVLTLLSAAMLGSPHLRFTLWPPPIRWAGRDASDPQLWYADFIQHRSAGIEGIQDFYAVAAIPRNVRRFCVTVRLQRLFVVAPPEPQLSSEPYVDELFHKIWMFEYLNRRFPPGTPTDELDIDVFAINRIPPPPDSSDYDGVLEWLNTVNDIVPGSPTAPPPADPGDYRKDLLKWYKSIGDFILPGILDPVPGPTGDVVKDIRAADKWLQDFKAALAQSQRIPKIQPTPRPVVARWDISGPRVLVWISSQPQVPGPYTYKWATEVWLQMKQEEYEAQLAMAPFERGEIVSAETVMRVCFEFQSDGTVKPSTDDIQLIERLLTTAQRGSAKSVLWRDRLFPSWALTRSATGALAGRVAALRSNAVDALLRSEVLASEALQVPFRFDRPTIVQTFMTNAVFLDSLDPANLALHDLAKWLGLSAALEQRLKAQGIKNLRELAAHLQFVAMREVRLGSQTVVNATKNVRRSLEKKDSDARTPKISKVDVNTIRSALAKSLQRRYEQAQKERLESRSRPIGRRKSPRGR